MNLLIGLNNKKQMISEYIRVKLLKHVIKDQLKEDVNEVGRKRLLIEARFIYFYILREKEKMVYKDIGDTVSMNHASVLHGFKKAEFWLEKQTNLETN